MSDEPSASLITVVDHGHAPVVFFDTVFASNHFNGIITALLSNGIGLPVTGETKLKVETVAAAHLRTNVQGAIALRNALDAAILAAMPTEGTAN